MIYSLFLMLLITAGGYAVTYLISDDEPVLWRLAAGCVIGTAIFGTAGFVLGLAFGLTPMSVAFAMLLTLVPLLLFLDPVRRRASARERARARTRVQSPGSGNFYRFLYYVFFLILFVLFFDRAMIDTTEGIFTGGSNNLGDLPFHLGAIYSFLENGFTLENPNFEGAKFSYPFISDLVTAMFMRLGAEIRDAMAVQNVLWAFALVVLLIRYVEKLTNDKTVARLVPAIFLFSGGLGFIWLAGDAWAHAGGVWNYLWNLPKDYTIGDEFRWGNTLVTLFLTQRSLLLGMPLTLIILGVLYEFGHREKAVAGPRFTYVITAGLLAGSLVLIHPHSLFVLFVVSIFGLLYMPRIDDLRRWAVFAACVAMIAVPELFWTMSGSATKAGSFFGWQFGWDKGQNNFLWFWFKNTGLLWPLIGLGLYLLYRQISVAELPVEPEKTKKGKKARAQAAEELARPERSFKLLWLYAPFFFLFVLANIARLAPWVWDNIKILVYWHMFSVIFVAIAIAWLWRKKGWFAAAAGVGFATLVLAGAADVWRTVSKQVNMQVFDADAILVAQRIRASTPKDAVFLNNSTHNSAVVLSGRSSLLRYPGHLFSHGIEWQGRAEDMKAIYRGGERAEELIDKYGVDHILISPEERGTVSPNEEYFSRYPVIAEAAEYKVYRVRD
ncbi:MAG TPA: hypothetical protein VK918_09250 [Pyrinomonadaceae bacterium]|nr:hypothetical protein [Pyrinomonadaceae bacterium]